LQKFNLNSKKHIVSAIHVSKVYPLDGIEVKALDDVNISVDKGEFVAIIGPSGSGKSTLMHLIGALDTPTKGDVFIDGKNIAKLDKTQLAKVRNQKIGFVFQQFNLLNKTSAIQNVEIPLIYAGVNEEKRQEMSKKMLQKVGLGERMQNHPNQLSGGQQQRVAIARALINNPAIILADEPTGNLDTKTGKNIMQFFHQLNKEGKTIILVTHDPEIAKQADRQIKIRDGKII